MLQSFVSCRSVQTWCELASANRPMHQRYKVQALPHPFMSAIKHVRIHARSPRPRQNAFHPRANWTCRGPSARHGVQHCLHSVAPSWYPANHPCDTMASSPRRPLGHFSPFEAKTFLALELRRPSRPPHPWPRRSKSWANTWSTNTSQTHAPFPTRGRIKARAASGWPRGGR